MKIVKLTATIAGAAMLVNVIPAVASTQISSSGQFQHSSDLSKRVEKKLGQKTPNESLRYSDREVAQLLLAGQGTIAEEKPELLQQLGFSREKPTTDSTKLNLMIDEYLTTAPDFHNEVAVPFQSEDPRQVDEALASISESFLKYAETKQASAPANEASLQGWTWMGANAVLYANAAAVANAVVYTNAAVATLAVATIALVTWYLPDASGQASTIDRQERISTITKIMADE